MNNIPTSPIVLATKQEFEERNRLSHDPNCVYEDETGHPAEPWQIELYNKLSFLLENRKWTPTIIEDSGKFGVWDQFNEKLLVPTEFDEIGDLEELTIIQDVFEGPIPVRKDGFWGIVYPDGKGTTAAPFKFEEIKAFTNDTFRLFRNGKYGVVHFPFFDGLKFILTCKADNVVYNQELGLCIHQINGKLGIAAVTKAEYDHFEVFDDEENSVVGYKDGTKGLISKYGDFIPLEEISKYDPKEILYVFYT